MTMTDIYDLVYAALSNNVVVISTVMIYAEMQVQYILMLCFSELSFQSIISVYCAQEWQ